jgi:hypothetical protein
VEKDRLILGPCNLVEGTPVFDIKPYIPGYDSFPDERAGWIDEMEVQLAAPPAWQVGYAPLAQAQADWLQERWGIDFRPRLGELLGRDPAPHRTRRIKRGGDGRLSIGCGAWRAWFVVEGMRVEITGLAPGFPLRFLHREGSETVPDRVAQLAFLTEFGEAGGGE